MSSKTGFLPWLIWTLAALFVVFNYVQQVVPNVITADLSRAFGATESTLGTIAGCYFYAYAILQIPVGLIVDRFGTRRPLFFAILVAGLATLAFSRANGVLSAETSRFFMGASAAFSFIGCLKLAQAWFPPSVFSTLAGMTNTAGMLGGASGPLVAKLVSETGWRETLAWMGGSQIILAALVFAIVRDVPMAPNQPAGNPSSGLGKLLGNPQVWFNAIYATTISLVFVAFGGLWGTSYIQKVYGLDNISAAGAGSYLFWGGIPGSLFFGWISDYLGKRKLPMVLAGIGALVTMGALLYLPGLPLPAFKLGLFLLAFFSSANIVSYAAARDLFPKMAGFSIGFLSTCYYAGSGASAWLVGLLLEHRHAGGTDGGLAALTPADFRFALSSLEIFMVVAVIASLLFKETLSGEGEPRGIRS